MSAETARYEPERDYIRSFLLLRWLLLILAAYLTLFPNVAAASFGVLYAFLIVFAASNIACMFVSYAQFQAQSFRLAISLVDAIFVSVTFYFLGGSHTYLFVPFILLF